MDGTKRLTLLRIRAQGKNSHLDTIPEKHQALSHACMHRRYAVGFSQAGPAPSHTLRRSGPRQTRLTRYLGAGHLVISMTSWTS